MLCQSTVLEICDVSPVDAETCDVTDSEGFVWLLHSRVVSLFSLDEGVSVPLADLMLAAVASSLLAARILLRRVLGRTRKPARRCRELLAAHGIGLTDADCAVLLAEVTGVLDDRTWARDLAEIRFERRKDGPLAIRQWLGQRGFDPETVRQAIAGLGNWLILSRPPVACSKNDSAGLRPHTPRTRRPGPCLQGGAIRQRQPARHCGAFSEGSRSMTERPAGPAPCTRCD